MPAIDPLPAPLDKHPLPHLVVADERVVAANRAARDTFAVLQAAHGAPPRWSQLFADGSPPVPTVGPPAHVVVGIRPGSQSRLELHGLATGFRGQPATLVVVHEADHAHSSLQALAESEANFRDMAENVPGALFRYLLRPDGTDAVLYMGPHCLDLWEIPAEDVMRDASPLWAMILPEDLPAMQASVMTSARDLSPWSHAWRIVPASGRTKWLQAWGRPRRLADGSTLWNSFILDVTAQRASREEAERLRLERAKAQQLEALGRMAGGIAHDFNNLLTVILGSGESALREAAAGSMQAEELHELLLAARRSADLVRRLLAFAKRQPAGSATVNPYAAVAELLPLLRRLAGPRIAVESTVLDAAPPVRIDPVQFDQCLTNLVANARDAMPDGGRLEIIVRAAGRDGRDGASVAVRDTGAGMSPDVLARLFEPFFTTKPADRGTGLGMAIVAGAMEHIGGHVSVESAVGAGTTITLWMPAAERDEPAPPPRAGAPELPARVLLVEDEDQIRRFVMRVLDHAGIRVHTAATAAGALALLDGPDSVDLVLTDIVLPGSSGIELYRRLESAIGPVPVLFMSGYVSDQAVTEALDRMHQPVLTKPFTREQLLQAVRVAYAAGPPAPRAAAEPSS